jgi:hypothetical protein
MNDFRGESVFHAVRAEDLQEVIPREPLQQADHKSLPIKGASPPTPSQENVIGLGRIDLVIPKEGFQLSLDDFRI